MRPEDEPILIYSTFPSLDDAKRVGHSLVEQRLAACVNIFPGMKSIYEWQGKLEEGEEIAMLIKTRRELQQRVIDATVQLHPFETPAVLVLEIGGGADDFCAWIAERTRPPVR